MLEKETDILNERNQKSVEKYGKTPTVTQLSKAQSIGETYSK